MSNSSTIKQTSLKKEILFSGIERVKDLVTESINLIRSLSPKGGEFDLHFNIQHRRPTEDFAIMQALIYLRRLRLLVLKKCNLALLEKMDPIDITNTSSGQQQILSSVFGLVGEMRSESLILIDEPELSLHPKWQVSYLDTLESTLRNFSGCHVIIATHSPLIVQSALAKRFEVIQLIQDATKPLVKPEALPQNVSVEAALMDVFHTPIANSAFLANELFDIVSDAEGDDYEARGEAIDRLNYLRDLYQTNQQSTDQKSVNLIEDALEFVQTANMDDQENG